MRRAHLAIGIVVVVALLALAGTAWAAQGDSNASLPTLVDPTPTTGAQADQAAYLGITMVAAGDKAATRLNVPAGTEGAVILKATANSPAAAAGLKAGDVITSVDNVAVKSPADVTSAVQKHKPGDVISLGIKRGSETLTIQVTAGTAPVSRQQKLGRGFAFGGLGLGGNLPPELQGLQNVPANELFGHLYGSTTRFKDANGNVVTVNLIPGTVTAVSAASITIQPNDPQGRGGPFSIDSTTRILAGGRGGGSDTLAVGDKVTVVVVGDASHASVIARGAALGGLSFNGANRPGAGDALGKLRNFLERGLPKLHNRGRQASPQATPTPGTF